MAKKLGFTYTLSVDERQSTANLKTSIKNIKEKNPNLSIPINLKLNTTIPSETLKSAKEILQKKNLNLPVDLKINAKSITNATITEAQKVLNEKSNKLSLSIGLKIDTKAIAKLENINATFKEMKGLTNDVVKNVQKLAGVKLQVYEEVDSKGKVKNNTKGVTKSTGSIDLDSEIEAQQRLIKLQIDSLKRKKEYQYIGQSIIEDLELQNQQLGIGATNLSDIKEEAKLLKIQIKEVANEASKNLYTDNNLSKGITEETKKQVEQEKIKTKHKQSQQQIALQINKLINGKNGEFLTGQDITRLKSVEDSFKNLNATSMTQINNSLRDTRQAINEISNDANNKRLNATSESIETLGKKLQNLGLYVSGAMVIQELWSAIHSGVGYIKELDEAYTDVAISMNITKSEFKEWTRNAREIAQANGQMTTSAMDMVKIYATAGESISEIEDKLAGTLAIQNITQWTAEQTTSAVSSVLGQYKLLEQEINGVTGDVANAIEYMGDALVGISNELTIDNVAGIQEMINAIDTAGGIMYQSGASMEWYMAVTGALKETMNATGDEVANAFKMISARVFAQAQAMEELGESAENIEIEMRKAEQALTSVGVAVRDASDPSKLRGLEEIMDELAGKWGTLSDATKNFVAEGVAGTNRRNY